MDPAPDIVDPGGARFRFRSLRALNPNPPSRVPREPVERINDFQIHILSIIYFDFKINLVTGTGIAGLQG